MKNLSMAKTPMPLQKPEKRVCTFEEVALGYTEEQAVLEADRCLHCKNSPCTEGCPVGIRIPDFIARIAEKDMDGAYGVISLSSSLAAICGRVCPQETQCEQRCVRGIKGEPVAIGRLERYAADHAEQKIPETKKKNGHRVAVIGSGPSGLTCAGELAIRGYSVTVWEALHEIGGVLVYGIPEFRLPKTIVRQETEKLSRLGVQFRTDVIFGKTFTLDDLFAQGYEAVFIGTGAGLPRFMGIPGENLCGVSSANEFLTRVNLMKAYRKDAATPIYPGKKTVVVGGGNVAMDAARCARRLGADVRIIYRRSEAELPARREEIEHAKEEGIRFELLTNPVKIHGDENGRVCSMDCIRMQLGEPDSSGRRRPEAVAGSEFCMETDHVILALGTTPNPLLHSATPGLSFNARGGIVVREDGATSLSHVYAGGDAVTGAATVISAMGAGKQAAEAIDRELG